MADQRANPPGDDYDTYVDHPRYGRGPRITGLNPEPYADGVHLHWNSTTYKELKSVAGDIAGYDLDKYGPVRPRRIPNTAIVADLDRQSFVSIPVTHYFDLARYCRECKRPFIFFAEEQKHWYEELGFGLDSDCVRCVECRKKEQGLARHRETYQRLFHVRDRDVEQSIDMAEACLALIEAGVFRSRKTETVRMLFNSIPSDASVRKDRRFLEFQRRLVAAEGQEG